MSASVALAERTEVVAVPRLIESPAVAPPSLSGLLWHAAALEATYQRLTRAMPIRLGRVERLLKRTLDVALTVPGLLVLLPVLLLISIAICVDSGWPIIYGQRRVGEGGRLFRMYKFRTMIRHAERRTGQVPIVFPDRRRAHKTVVDPRITRVGRFLRRTSLDELPQLLNVLRGDMSLVGPRPELPELAAAYDPWQWARFSVPPGLTGLWQIRGRSLRPIRVKCLDDIEYIVGYSLWLDVRILLQTFVPVVTGRGAF